MEKSKKSLKSILLSTIFFVSLVAVVSGSTAGYFILSEKENKINSLEKDLKKSEDDNGKDSRKLLDEIDQKIDEISDLENQIDSLEKDLEKEKGKVDTCEQSCKSTDTIVVFEASGSFSDTEKSRLKARYIEPFIDYQKSESGGNRLVSVIVSPNPFDASKGDYPFTFMGVFESGAYESFLIQDSLPIDQDWWVPGCIIECTFSDEFTAKYPEIVALS